MGSTAHQLFKVLPLTASLSIIVETHHADTLIFKVGGAGGIMQMPLKELKKHILVMDGKKVYILRHDGKTASICKH